MAKVSSEKTTRTKDEDSSSDTDSSPSSSPYKVPVQGLSGDFKWMIDHDRHLKALYVFDDDIEDHSSARPGYGNAVIRPFNRLASKTPVRSAGICIGQDGRGFRSLSFEAKTIIDRDIGEISELLASGEYHLIYNAEKDNPERLVTGIQVGLDVRSYIVKKLKRFGCDLVKWCPSQRWKRIIGKRQLMVDPMGGLVGIPNPEAYRCFMNATLQCLSHLEPVVGYFLSGRYEKHINDKTKEKEQEKYGRICIARAFADFQEEVWKPPPKAQVCDPTLIFTTLKESERLRSLFIGQHQCACEFLELFLDALSADLNRVAHTLPWGEWPDEATKARAEAKRKAEEKVAMAWRQNIAKERAAEYDAATQWRKMLMERKSFVQDLFSTQTRTTVTCLNPKCSNVSRTYADQLILQLPIVPDDDKEDDWITNIEDALNAYCMFASMGLDEYECEPCCGVDVKPKKRVKATKDETFWKLPPVLCLQLKRFYTCVEDGCLKKKKNPKKLDSPLTLDLTKLASSEHREKLIYDIVGVINHIGDFLEQGHYTAMCKHPITEKWYKFDDANPCELIATPETTIMTEETYMLFLLRRDSGKPVEHMSFSKPQGWPHILSKNNSVLKKRDAEKQDEVRRAEREVFAAAKHAKFKAKELNPREKAAAQLLEAVKSTIGSQALKRVLDDVSHIEINADDAGDKFTIVAKAAKNDLETRENAEAQLSKALNSTMGSQALNKLLDDVAHAKINADAASEELKTRAEAELSEAIKSTIGSQPLKKVLDDVSYIKINADAARDELKTREVAEAELSEALKSSMRLLALKQVLCNVSDVKINKDVANDEMKTRAEAELSEAIKSTIGSQALKKVLADVSDININADAAKDELKTRKNAEARLSEALKSSVGSRALNTVLKKVSDLKINVDAAKDELKTRKDAEAQISDAVNSSMEWRALNKVLKQVSEIKIDTDVAKERLKTRVESELSQAIKSTIGSKALKKVLADIEKVIDIWINDGDAEGELKKRENAEAQLSEAVTSTIGSQALKKCLDDVSNIKINADVANAELTTREDAEAKLSEAIKSSLTSEELKRVLENVADIKINKDAAIEELKNRENAEADLSHAQEQAEERRREEKRRRQEEKHRHQEENKREEERKMEEARESAQEQDPLAVVSEIQERQSQQQAVVNKCSLRHRSLREGDAVQVFVKKVPAWVDGKVEERLEGNKIRVRYTVGDEHQRKVINLDSDKLSEKLRVPAPPEKTDDAVPAPPEKTDQEKAEDLWGKGFSVRQLLHFFKDKVRPMDHMMTTEDVVMKIIIPETPRTCYMETGFMERLGGPKKATTLVSHDLKSTFANTMLNVVLDASGRSRVELEDLIKAEDEDRCYNGFLDDFDNILPEVEACLLDILSPDELDHTYWLSMFAEHCAQLDPSREVHQIRDIVSDLANDVVVSLDPGLATLEHVCVLHEINKAAAIKKVGFQCIAGLNDKIAEKLKNNRWMVKQLEQSKYNFEAERYKVDAVHAKEAFDSLVSIMVEMSLGIFRNLPKVKGDTVSSLGKLRKLDITCLVSVKSSEELGWESKDNDSIAQQRKKGSEGKDAKLWQCIAAVEELRLSFANIRTLVDAVTISKRLRELKHLQRLHMSFSRCENLSDVSSIGLGVEELTNLEYLHMSFSWCEQLANVYSIGNSLKKLKLLRHLNMNFSGCSELADFSPIGVGVKELKNLHTLHVDFSWCTKLADATSIGLNLQRSKELQHLHMNFSFCLQLTDVSSIGLRIKELTSLRQLHMNFSGCEQLANASPIGSGLGTLTNLEHLHMDFSRWRQLEDVSSIGSGLKKLKHLQRLHISFESCSELADVSCIGLGANELKHLYMNFTGCKQLADVSSIGSAMKTLKKLEFLHMSFSGCSRLADVSSIGLGLKELNNRGRYPEVSGLQHLHMNFSWCKALTDVSSIGLGLRVLENIQNLHVNFSGCEELADVSSIGSGAKKFKNPLDFFVGFESCNVAKPLKAAFRSKVALRYAFERCVD